MAGRLMRNDECIMPGIERKISEGALSFANASQATSRPALTTAVNAPQWDKDGKRCSLVVAVIVSLYLICL